METYKLVADESQIREFYEKVLAPLQEDESYFFALSARHKKLTEEERKEYLLGRTEMFGKQFVRLDNEGHTIDHIISAIYKYECNKKAYLTKNGKTYPDKTLVLYGSINPSSDSECVAESMKYAIQVLTEMMMAAKKGSMSGISDNISKFARTHAKTKENHPRLPSRKVFMDFDADIAIPNELEHEFFEEIKKRLTEKLKYTPTIIRTAGGFHTIVKKEYIKFNPTELVEIIDDVASGYGIVSSEIKKNDNNMVPIPGTYQYGVPVYMI